MAGENKDCESSSSLLSLNNLGADRQNNPIASICPDLTGCKIWRVKNKGSILVLILSYLVSSSMYLYTEYDPHLIWLIPFTITTAISGWLADAYIGRYKMISCGVWTAWLLTVAVTVSAVVGQFSGNQHKNKIEIALLCLSSIGLGVFHANIIQFGLDQLHDASTTEIKSFIVWYVITVFGAGFFGFNFFCLNEQLRLFIWLLVCLSLSLALIILIYCNHWLIKEPAAQGPLKLVYKVIKFAIVTKHPLHRSAFTYCEDELPSRIDFGKSKYGGPFTTEQVEDVKTFLRLIPLIFLIGTIAGISIASLNLYIHLEKQYTRFIKRDLKSALDSRKAVTECYAETSVTDTVAVGIILLMILHEFLIYPLFHRCIHCHIRIKSLWKLIAGTALQILMLAALITLYTISRHIISNYSEHNVTIQCTFHRNSSDLLGQTLSPRWLAIPQYLHYISLAFNLVGVIEFISSQAPYSMKGVIFGAQFTLILVCSTPSTLLQVLFKQDLSIWGKGTIGCEFWYGLIVIVVNLAVFFAMVWMAKRYKLRKRDDLLPNEHFFAERYYSSEP